MPHLVSHLLDIALINAMATDVEISLVSEQGKEVLFKFKEDAHLNPEALPEVLALYPRKMKFVAGKQAIIRVDTSDILKKELISYIKSILQVLNKLKKTSK